MNATMTEPVRIDGDEDALVEIRNGAEIKYKHRYRVPEIDPPKRKPFYGFVKRANDILLSLLGTVLLALPMLVIAAAVKLDSKGPALYKQERLGKDGKPFFLLKFRSMRNDAEKDGAKWAEENDDRVTRVGRFLRKSRLDELPQLFCILRGSMTLVGPRPERPVFYDEFDKYLDGFRQRLLVLPGLTGLAQVSGGYDLEPEEKIVYDLEYIKKRSLGMDLKILFRTVGILFNHNGAR